MQEKSNTPAHSISGNVRYQQDVVLAWFQAGLYYTTAWQQEGRFTNDKDIFLVIAEHCLPKWKKSSFSCASPALKGYKKFMAQVLQKDPTLSTYASERLQNDFDLATLTFSGSCLIIQCWSCTFLHNLYEHLKNNINLLFRWF